VPTTAAREPTADRRTHGGWPPHTNRTGKLKAERQARMYAESQIGVTMVRKAFQVLLGPTCAPPGSHCESYASLATAAQDPVVNAHLGRLENHM
jgi:hypothetical protein